MKNHPPTIALIPNDVIGASMAGPGIRYWEFAQVLTQALPVKVLLPPLVAKVAETAVSPQPFSLIPCQSQAQLKTEVATCDVIITRGVILTAYPFLMEMGKYLVLDMYSPILLESLQQLADAEPLAQFSSFENNLAMINSQLSAADFILCASEKQRDYWLGVLSAIGRINPHTHAQDHTLRQLIDVVPFGLPEKRPFSPTNVLKGVYPGIKETDKVILWGGGIWNWLDVPTLIRAMAQVKAQRDDVKLFFMGTKRPNQDVVDNTAVLDAIQLTKDLNLQDTVIFNDWVAYDERHHYLRSADVGISLHRDHIETRFSFRTRLLDYVWCGLPTIATAGDVLAETMAEHGVAQLVHAGDISAVAQAILHACATPNQKETLAPRFEGLAHQFHWAHVAKPLVGYCLDPHPAADRAYQPPTASHLPRSLQLMQKSWQALRRGGWHGLKSQIAEYVRWQKRK